jgi:hypothetical protein
MFNTDGTPELALGVGEKGGAGIVIHDHSGKDRASFVIDADGSPTLRMGDASGSRIGLDVTPDGRPGVALLGSNGVTRASLTLNSDGSGALTLFDSSGNAINSLP